MRDAEVCPDCDGNGSIEHVVRDGCRLRDYEERCWTCDGTGYLDVPSDRQRRAAYDGVD